MTKDERIQKETRKLKAIFKALGKEKLKTAEGLISRAAFMGVSLSDLERIINEKGYTEEYQNGANQHGTKKSSEVEIYNTMVKNYTTTIKALVDMAPGDETLDPAAAELLAHISRRK